MQERLEQIINVTKNFYIKHNNNVKLIYRDTPKGTSILGTYSCKTLFSRTDSSAKDITRTFHNNIEFVETIEKNNIDVRNIVEDKKYVIVSGITSCAFVWLKYSCYIEYLICEKFSNALYLETSILASGKIFMPSKFNIDDIVNDKIVNVRISSDIIKIIDKRNIFIKF